MVIADKMAALEDLLRWMREDSGRNIPDMDENDGGVNARVLLLLNEPTRTATKISRDNDDATARLVSKIHAGRLDRELTLSWNVVPYYAANTREERERSRPYLEALLGMLPHLEVVILSGSGARAARGWISEARPDVTIFETKHPGRQGLYAHHGYDEYVRAVEAAAAIVAARPATI
jgi:hypothetical protein